MRARAALLVLPTVVLPVVVPAASGAAAGSQRVSVVVRGLDVGQARGLVGSLAVRHRLPLVDGFSARLTAGQARALERVRGVQVDRVRRVSVTDTATDRDFGAKLARETFSTTGAGVGVCVVDTGVDPRHEQVAPRSVTFKDFIGTAATAYDDHGHGTHVTSIAAGDGDSATGAASASAAAHVGVAPGAALYAAKVLDGGGSGPDDGVIAGVQWCAGQAGVRVISMSLGDSVPSDGTDPLSAAVDAATAAGKVVVVAAGNAGDSPSTIPSPGAAATAVTVGAVSDWSAPAGADYRDAGIALAPFSSRGPVQAPGGPRTEPDVTAPGVTVSAADAGSGTGYVAMSGTSMATPYVAGVVALGLAEVPAATPAAVKAALESSARDRGAAGKDDEWGAGLVDAEGFVQALAGSTNDVTTAYPSASRLTGSVGTGGSTTLAVPVTAADAPLAITVTITSGSQGCLLFWPGQGCAWPGEWSPDLDAELRSPSGTVVATSSCALSGWLCTAGGRQETLLVQSPVVGTYSLRVYAWNGGPGGTFSADVSSGPVVGGSAPPPPPTNAPPTVSAGPDKTVTLAKGVKTTTVTMTGTASDPDDIASVRWSSGSSTVSTDYTATVTLGPGSYAYTFTATDTKGASASDGMTVTVKRR